MTPQEYNETRKRLGLTHKELADRLGVLPQISRAWSSTTPIPPVAVSMLRLIELVGPDEISRVIEANRTEHMHR